MSASGCGAYTYLVETDSSNRLLFNDNNLIVMTEIFATRVRCRALACA